MKAAPCLLALLCVFAFAVQGQKAKKSQPRVLNEPPHYYKAEAFIEMDEGNRMLYISGLMDGFFASAMFGASEKTVTNLQSCTEDMDSKQVSAIITKYVKDHPETWHLPLSIEAYNALNGACPGGLKITN